MTERLMQARAVMQALPHAQSLGMIVTATAEGSATITMPYDTRLIGDPATGVFQPMTPKWQAGFPSPRGRQRLRRLRQTPAGREG